MKFNYKDRTPKAEHSPNTANNTFKEEPPVEQQDNSLNDSSAHGIEINMPDVTPPELHEEPTEESKPSVSDSPIDFSDFDFNEESLNEESLFDNSDNSNKSSIDDLLDNSSIFDELDSSDKKDTTPKEDSSFGNNLFSDDDLSVPDVDLSNLFGEENDNKQSNVEDIGFENLFNDKSSKSETETNTASSISDADITEPESKKGKKSKKKNKEKEPKEKTEKKKFSLPFGKKKKQDLLNKLDEIAQDETTPDTDTLLSELETDAHLENLDTQENVLTTEQENENSENTPDVLLENESIPFVGFDDDETQDQEQEEPPEKITVKKEETLLDDEPDTNNKKKTKDVKDKKKKSLFGKKSKKDDVIPTELEADLEDELDDLRDKSKKKKGINPKLLIILLIVLIIIGGVFFAVKTLFFTGNTVNNYFTPPIQSNDNLDMQTVENVVQESQEIVNTANSAATEYAQNNELPPQVGIDLEQERVNENTNLVSDKKYFANENVSFEYPSDWVSVNAFNLRETDANVSNIVMLGLTPVDVSDTNNMRITVEETLTAITAKEYMAQTENLMKESFTNIKTRKSTELTVSGKEAPSRIYTFNDESGNSVEQFQVYVASGRKMYVITFTSSETNFAKNLNTYKSILKTLVVN